MARPRRNLISEKFGAALEAHERMEQVERTPWFIDIPKDVENVGTSIDTAPTTNPKRPRALTVGYNPGTNTLIVVFRDGTWWQYNNVPVETWMGLKSSESTGKYLRESGLDGWADMGPADLDALSESVKTRISSYAQTASGIQNSSSAYSKVMSGEATLRDYTSKELFQDLL